VIVVEEEKGGDEDVDSRTGFKISNTKRRPPPKEKQRRRPPGIKIGKNVGEGVPMGRRRNPLKLKGTPKGIKPGTPGRGGKKGKEVKLKHGLGNLETEEISSDDDGFTPTMYNDSAPFKMQVMECIASSNPAR